MADGDPAARTRATCSRSSARSTCRRPIRRRQGLALPSSTRSDNFACVAGMVKLVLVDTRDGLTDARASSTSSSSARRTRCSCRCRSSCITAGSASASSRRSSSTSRTSPTTAPSRTSTASSRTARCPTTGLAKMVNVLVTGGAGFIGSNFVRHALDDAPRLASHDARQADLRRAAREPQGRDGPSAARVRQGRRRRSGGRRAARRRLEHRRPLRGRDARRSLDHERRRVHHDRRLRHVRAARGGAPGAATCAGSSRSRPTRSTAASPEGSSRETDELRPRNPYSASKAGADRLAYSYWATYEVPVVITRASNNYGPNQFPEKVIPLFITNAIDDIPVPLYGDGLNERDWLHVSDHCRALDRRDRARDARARSTTSAAATTCGTST